MKTNFTKEEVIEVSGCYSREQTLSLIEGLMEPININMLLSLDISYQDKCWFAFRSCELTLEEKKLLSLQLAWVVLPIYEGEYPEDNRVRECLVAIDGYIKGIVSKEEFLEKRKGAITAAADAYAVSYAADYADYAIAHAAAFAANAAHVIASYVYATSDASSDASSYATSYTYASISAITSDVVKGQHTYSELLLQELINFFKGN